MDKLAENESKVNDLISQQKQELSSFKEHMTQFINEFVENYEKRFNVLKESIDELVDKIESKTKQQRAMIFE